MTKNYFFLFALCVSSMSSSIGLAQVTYNGNGNTGFGGTVGNGSLVVNDDGTNISFEFTQGNAFNDNMVIYFDSQANGFSDTTTFTDDSDGGRSAVSTRNGSNNPTINFPTGFEADYALAIGDSFAALFELVSAGPHNFVAGANFSGSSPTYTITLPFTALNLSSGDGFDFVVSYISGSAFLSNEVIGTTDPLTDNPGFTGTINFTAANTYSGTLSTSTNTLNEVSILAKKQELIITGIQGSKHDLSIFDLNGRQLLQKELRSDQTIPLNGIQSGVYIVSIENNGRNLVRKMLID
jgi:hypothetical protein